MTVFDDRYPGIGNLDPLLLRALREAAAEAATAGIRLYVNSGWRSPAFQNQLRCQAVWTYRSESEAARWVTTADTSAHVSGHAVDLSRPASSWLATYGAKHGLCQIYYNEPWHFELRPEAIEHGRSPMYPDPAHDPRMRR
ncbi:D-alanyl-D-alanine carboxypeptidase family protein [Nocardia sp. NPDC101769]|uniref:D-alanyl-D-alanine carboxypeptidase family protein n=1 Tax=Nocardia sp. NPDC101769 TaxID=3364333 RepID=UPI0038136FA1